MYILGKYHNLRPGGGDSLGGPGYISLRGYYILIHIYRFDGCVVCLINVLINVHILFNILIHAGNLINILRNKCIYNA